jgi:uncharacterized phage protein (TIGR02220 family)
MYTGETKGNTEIDIEIKKEIEKEYIPFKEIIEYLNSKTGSSYKHTSKTTQKHISARWDEKYKLEDFKKVIDIKTAEWLNDPNMNKFLRHETLFGTKFEGYLNQKPGQAPQKPKYNPNNFTPRGYDANALQDAWVKKSRENGLQG